MRLRRDVIVECSKCSCNCTCKENNDCPTREEMMNNIRGFNFAITELALYLDTHPYDTNALAMHKDIANAIEML